MVLKESLEAVRVKKEASEKTSLIPSRIWSYALLYNGIK